MLIAVNGVQSEHGRPVIDVDTGKASGIESDNLEQIPVMYEHSRRDAGSSCILVA